MYAAHGNHPHATNELLNHSADLTLSNLNDDTALSIAVKHSSKEGNNFRLKLFIDKLNKNWQLTICSFFPLFSQAQTVIEGYLFMLLQPS